MATQATLNAETRQGVRKGANRKLRATGRVPAILYGKDHEPTLLSVDAREAERLFPVAPPLGKLPQCAQQLRQPGLRVDTPIPHVTRRAPRQHLHVPPQ